jgi:hypothetical protein
MKLSFKMRFIISTAASNFLVVFVTLFENVGLDNVAKVYWFQLCVTFVLTSVRILSAEYVDRPSRDGREQPMLATKAVTLGMLITFDGLFLFGHFAILFLWLNTGESPAQTVILIAKCSVLFLVGNFLLFRWERRNGFHKKLVSDGEVFMFWVRIQFVLVPCLLFLSTKQNQNLDYSDEQFLLVLVMIAILDIVM